MTRDDAISLLKTGTPPAAIYSRLMAAGMTDAQARSMLDELLALKHKADAMDPARLRNEAIWMLWNGAPAEQVVQHFVAAGVADEHARPEVDRIAVAITKMRPCDRCRRPMDPAAAFFDGYGRQVCKTCNSMDEIGNAQRRVVDGAMEMIGVPSWAVQLSQTPYQNQSMAPSTPTCPRCGTWATFAYGRWGCGRCSTYLS